MAITSLSFFLFLLAVYLLYYLIPPKSQWILLLISSIFFYISIAGKGIVFMLLACLATYLGARAINDTVSFRKVYLRDNKENLTKEEKSEFKKQCNNKNKTIQIAIIIFVLALLLITKYNVGRIKSLVVPLGISYYSLMLIGYITEVYWENQKAENNFFKFLLYVSFFPQITQGPISDFGAFSPELYKEHNLSYEGTIAGFIRMIWGFFKKMVVADVLSPYVVDAFSNYQNYNSIALIVSAGLFMAQLYMDFSGYMDIMCGFSEMLGIRMTENFNRPFFSKTVSEFWRRWHITLGAWLKKYIYFPVITSKIADRNKRLHNKRVAELLNSAMALCAVWFITGFWHAAKGTYIIWGLLNGLVILSTLIFAPFYDKFRNKLSISNDRKIYHVFQIIRTSVIITAFEIIAGSDSISSGLEYLEGFFSNWRVPTSVFEIVPYLNGQSFMFVCMFGVALFGIFLQFIVSFYEENNHREIKKVILAKKPIWGIALLTVMILLICLFGVEASWDAGGFMYANF